MEEDAEAHALDLWGCAGSHALNLSW